MAQYNLINEGIITTATGISGSNLSLSQSQLEVLYNGSTVSGIQITDSDILCMDIDLMNRVLVESLGIYILLDQAPSYYLDDVDFYYKNEIEDDYVSIIPLTDADSFYINYSDDSFSPRYIRLIITNVSATVFEVYVNNSDYKVAFGDDGTVSSMSINDYDNYNCVQIYNNSESGSLPVDAYISVEYTDSPIDNCITLSNSVDGPYYGLDEGIGINYSSMDSYIWEHGTFENTMSYYNRLKLIPYDYSQSIDAMFNNCTVLPIPAASSDCGWGIGQNCWDFNCSGVIYALSLPSNTADLLLYKYNVSSGSWVFVDTMGTGGTNASMVCVGNYIYILTNNSGNLVRYNLEGPLGNLETLPTASTGSVSKYVQAMCSDKVNYIYTAFTPTLEENTGFERFNIESNSWEILSSGYRVNTYSNYSSLLRCVLSYNIYEDALYFDCGASTYTNGYFQKYTVASDSWNTSWKKETFGYRSRGHSYYGGHLAYASEDHEYYIKVFNVYTQKTRSFLLPYKPNTNFCPEILCFPSGDGNVMVAITKLDSSISPGNVYFYCIGRDYMEPQVGYYTTPVFSVNNNNSSSFLRSIITTSSGTAVSVDDNEVSSAWFKCSNVPPKGYYRMFLGYKTSINGFHIASGDLNTGVLSEDFLEFGTSDPVYDRIDMMMYCEKSDNFTMFIRETNGVATTKIVRYNFKYNTPTVTTGYTSDYYITDQKFVDVDTEGGIWGYKSKKLFRLKSSFASYSYSLTGSDDFVSCLSADKFSTGCWYADKSEKNLIHIDSSGNTLLSIAITSPVHVDSTADGGCFVFNDAGNEVSLIDYNGDEVTSFYTETTGTVTRMVVGVTLDGFYRVWILDSGQRLLVFDIEGNLLNELFTLNISSLVAYNGGCLAHSKTDNVTYQVDSEGVLIKIWEFSSLGECSYLPFVITATYADMVDMSATYLHAFTDDTVWENSTGWAKLNLSRNLLPLKSFYQFKFRLSAESLSETPYIDKVMLPQAVKIENINPNSSKPVYIKTELKSDMENKEYDTKLRCWWGR